MVELVECQSSSFCGPGSNPGCTKEVCLMVGLLPELEDIIWNILCFSLLLVINFNPFPLMDRQIATNLKHAKIE